MMIRSRATEKRAYIRNRDCLISFKAGDSKRRKLLPAQAELAAKATGHPESDWS